MKRFGFLAFTTLCVVLSAAYAFCGQPIFSAVWCVLAAINASTTTLFFVTHEIENDQR